MPQGPTPEVLQRAELFGRVLAEQYLAWGWSPTLIKSSFPVAPDGLFASCPTPGDFEPYLAACLRGADAALRACVGLN